MGFNTDKIRLGYLPTYLKLASEIGVTGRVCEVGVANGHSLEMWQTLFPRGVVVGVDNNPDCHWPKGTVKIVASQNDAALPKLLGQQMFDLIVEDASHLGALSRRTWELLWPLVVPGGYYVMEDWQVSFWGPPWDQSMLHTAESFLRELSKPDGAVEYIEYRHGRVILKKRQ